MGPSEIIVLVFMGWLFLNLATLFVALPTMGKMPMPWQVFRMVHECLGAILRKVRKKPNYKINMDSLTVLGLDPDSARTQDVAPARDRILAQMRKQFWTYPLSQRDAIVYLADNAHWLLAARDIAEQVRQEGLRWRREAEQARERHRRAQTEMEKELERLRQEELKWDEEYKRIFREQEAHARARQAKASRPAQPSWRQVLGLPENERDVRVIKQAYRKRAQIAHPDRGGSNDAMAKLNQAIEQAREELSFV